MRKIAERLIFMSRKLKLAMAQLNWVVGDIEGNCERMLSSVKAQEDADLVMFSELALCGYSPEDLLFRPDFQQRCETQLTRLEQASKNSDCCWTSLVAKRQNL